MNNSTKSIFLFITFIFIFFQNCSETKDESTDISDLSGENAPGKPEIVVSHDYNEITNRYGFYNFGIVRADGDDLETSDNVPFAVKNIGKKKLLISDLKISSGDENEFDLFSSVPAEIEPGKTAGFSVRFDPLTPGEKTSMVVIENNDPENETFTFNLFGLAENALPTPQNVTASEGLADRITISWNPADPSITKYTIYRDLKYNGDFSYVAGTVNNDVTTFDDFDANNATLYYYRVTSRNKKGESNKSSYAYGYRGTINKYFIIVEGQLFFYIEDNLNKYISSISGSGYTPILLFWDGGRIELLKDFLKKESLNLKGILLVGDLPAAWYGRVDAEYGWEEFPCDLFLGDLNGIWNDSNQNGIYDYHDLNNDQEIFVSRITGGNIGINNYFSKAVRYRKGELTINKRALIYVDDDWYAFPSYNYLFNVDDIYGFSNVTRIEEQDITVAWDYSNRLDDGYEYIFIWAHSSPTTHYFSPDASTLNTTQIAAIGPQAFFYNQFNCSGARFTEMPNLAHTYAISSDTGLATVGSTKTGAILYSDLFHDNLDNGKTWGEAFQNWYNGKGYSDDSWFLGMVILGDPLLKMSPLMKKISSPAKKTTSPYHIKETEYFRHYLKRWQKEFYHTLGKFKKYKRDNPHHFLNNPNAVRKYLN
jgi:hypothetical protein